MKKYMRHLNALRAFEAAGRLGRMTAAALELHVTPGAISRQVRQLEDALGVALFEGSKHSPSLTPAGQLLRPALSDAFRQMEKAVDAAIDKQATTLDVVCLSTFTMRWLIPRLYGFHARHPEIGVRLQPTDLDADASPARHDVSISVEPSVPAAGEVAVVLFAERLGPVLSPELASRLTLARRSDLAGQAVLCTRTRANAWAMWIASTGRPLRVLPCAEFAHYYFTLEAALAGLGICVAPWHLVMEDVRSGRLVAPFGFEPSGYHYVARARSATDETSRRFCAWLVEEAAAMPQPSATAC